MNFLVENHLNNYIENEKLLDCLQQIEEINKCRNVPVTIYDTNSIDKSITSSNFFGVSGGKLGIYKIDEKRIEIYTCNFLDVLSYSKSMIKLATLGGLLHEYRHSIQHKLMPTTFNNVLTGKKIYYNHLSEKYRGQFVEKDSRKFTEKMMNKYHSVITKALDIDDEWNYKDDIIYINGYEIML